MRDWRLLAGIVMFATTPGTANEDLDAAFARDVLIIQASEFACHRFDIYVAENDIQRRRGLMFVRDMAPMTGMLFVYDRSDYVAMWMKNTFIALDMLFVRADGTVASVAHNTEPQSLRSVASKEPVKFVLELNAGTAARLFIDENSRIHWERAHGTDE
ncbi:MAG: DUF192 domain-containing protein [Gammaproteobacteria bacterium]|nr:DUF192 domain-containing protein [Gammaproteobacteria bacterium]MDH3430717.1 DUF192 domain-containing protein [Gammaproteobacteria bacterium]MDH3435173.1 DUF192 domain-containing protein [Gammaproteobacteria bacterium]